MTKFITLFIKLELLADTIKVDTTKKSLTQKAADNIATGGMPKYFFLGVILFVILILILILLSRIISSDKAKGI